MTLRGEIRETLRLSWPLMGAQLLSLSMVFVDSVIVGRLGAAPLAAMAMAISLVGTLQIVCIGLLSPLSALVSQEVGAGRPEQVGRTVHRGLTLAFVLGGGMAVAMLGSGFVLRVLGQEQTLIPLARQFLLALAWGMPANLAYQALRQLSEGVSDTRPSVVIAGVGAIVNALLDYGLVYGRFGLPRLELTGAGLGTSVVQWTMFLSLLAYVRFNPRYAQYHLDRGEADDGHSLGQIIKLGLPFSGSLLAEVAFFAGSTLAMGLIGVKAQASHQIALNAASFLFMIPLGLSFALTIRVSRARGADDLPGVRRAAEAGMAMALCTQSACAAAFLFAPWPIARLYTDDPTLLPLAVSLIRIAGFFQLFDGIQVVTMGMLRGMLDTRMPFLITMFAYWGVGMPCSMLLTFPAGLGPQGLWYGLLAGLGCAAGLLQWRLWRLVSRPS